MRSGELIAAEPPLLIVASHTTAEEGVILLEALVTTGAACARPGDAQLARSILLSLAASRLFVTL